MVAGDEELGHGAAAGEELIAVVAAGGPHGEPDADQAGDARVTAAGAQADVGTEAEASEEEGLAGVACGEPVQGGADVLDLATALVVGAFAQACAAEVEAQHGQTEGREGLGRVVDDLVVHGAAAQRVGVGDQGGRRRVVARLYSGGLRAGRRGRADLQGSVTAKQKADIGSQCKRRVRSLNGSPNGMLRRHARRPY